MKARLLICLLAMSLALLGAGARAASAPDDSTKDDAGEWSREVNGLQLRLKLVEKGKLNGTLTAEKTDPEWKAWNGTIQTPPVKVAWK